jgi:hypothetical protein
MVRPRHFLIGDADLRSIRDVHIREAGAVALAEALTRNNTLRTVK